jgi:cytoskeletal protein CcmA (bactofilin family)
VRLLLPLLLLVLNGCQLPLQALAFRASQGCAEYEDEPYGQLQTFNGPIDLKRTLVTHYVTTDHNFSADCSDIGAVNVCGTAWIHQSIIRRDSCFHNRARFYESHIGGNITVCGFLYAADSCFNGNVYVDDDVTLACSSIQGCLTARAEMIDIYASNLQDIVVEATGPYYDLQVVRLSAGSEVNGDITFKSGRGKVCLESGSQLNGEVYGGNIMSRHYWQDH